MTIGRSPLCQTPVKLPVKKSGFWSYKQEMVMTTTFSAELTNDTAITRRGGMITAKHAEILTTILVISTEMVLDVTRMGTHTPH